MIKYQPKDIETKWQEKWQSQNIYAAQNNSQKTKKYILDMFPYPSGDGLHVGHFKIYNASDILARYFRFRDNNVLHPMGWDGFGLPAENYAIKTGINPRITTQINTSNIKAQMQMVGFSYDWKREINTTDPQYYKWTQWIFLKLLEHGLAYQDEAPINWCPKDKTGLANEEVVNGKCDRCGTPVERKVIRQWILKITDYADRLLEGLDGLDWPQFIKDMQINWIGRSEGSLVRFDIERRDYVIETFTTRVDTIFGVTALILAPEHEKINDLTTDEQKSAVESYQSKAKTKSDIERTELNKEKTGVFTGSYAINPINEKKLPIWVADYVLGFYGTGAVMLVPAHDSRDKIFAEKFNIEILEVVTPNGVLINSGEFNGLSIDEAKKAITGYLKDTEKADFQTQYKLRDWIFSRQRYWGEPIPVIHCPKDGTVPVPEEELPVLLPETENYQPTGTGDSPLASIPEWVNVKCPKCGKGAKRETNTMPQWAGSCWYYLRFIDPKNDQELVNQELEKYWMNIDWYIGGAEHAVLHLLYARFWHKFLYDIKVVSTKEPFQKLSSVGLVMAADGRKMSKSLGNIVKPDDIVNEYGADTLRIYEAFMGPFENSIAWDPISINGSYKFLTRIWALILKENVEKTDQSIEVELNRTIKKVTQGIESMKFNTSIASMMEFLNIADKKSLTQDQKRRFLVILSPFAPHMTEELWQKIGESFSIHQQKWPKVNKEQLEDDQLTLAVQVNGKLRATVLASRDDILDQKKIENMAMEQAKVTNFIKGKTVIKTIYIPGKILNLVVNN